MKDISWRGVLELLGLILLWAAGIGLAFIVLSACIAIGVQVSFSILSNR